MYTAYTSSIEYLVSIAEVLMNHVRHNRVSVIAETD